MISLWTITTYVKKKKRPELLRVNTRASILSGSSFLLLECQKPEESQIIGFGRDRWGWATAVDSAGIGVNR